MTGFLNNHSIPTVCRFVPHPDCPSLADVACAWSWGQPNRKLRATQLISESQLTWPLSGSGFGEFMTVFECPVFACVCVLVVQTCPTLCDPMDCNLTGFSVRGILPPEYWSGLLFPSPEELPNLGIEPWSPASQEDSLLFELISPYLGNHSMAPSTLRHTPTTCFLMGSSSMTQECVYKAQKVQGDTLPCLWKLGLLANLEVSHLRSWIVPDR